LARVGRTHIVIPDCQVKPGVPLDHLTWIGNYIASKRPDVVVNLGDFADMHSLSSYDIGKVEAEGARYKEDIKITHEAMRLLTAPLKKSHYKGDLHLTLGNHEDRISREAEDHPRLAGTLSIDDLEYERFGWRVHKFLKVVKIDSVEYSHYFVSGSMGRPVSSASALLRARHNSAIMGHVQRIDLAVHPNTQAIAVFAGICYLHDETYLTPQGQNTKRGIWVLNEVGGGTFDPMFVSLGFLKKNYS
jgi:hypothetical protein